MATTTSTMTAGENKPWTLEKTLATQTFNATLTTNGKYLDRDINITISTQAGAYDIEVPATADIETVKPVISDAGLEGALTVSPTTTKPTEGTYIALKTAGKDVTVTSTAAVTKAGFIDVGAKEATITFKTADSDVAYIPLNGTSASADADYGDLESYFEKGTSTKYDVLIKPNYTVPQAGYIGEANKKETNPSYWSVKKGAVNGWNKASTDAPGNAEKLNVSAVEVGGSIHIAQGWHEESYITLGDLIPNVLEPDALNSHLLYGHQAFNENGVQLIGTICTYDTKHEKGFTGSHDKNTYFISGTTGASKFGVIPAYSYVAEQLSIKPGSVSNVAVSGSVKPVIAKAAVDDTTTPGAKNITSSVSGNAPTEAYYVAVKTNSGKGQIHSDVSIKAGWQNADTIGADHADAITLQESEIAYAPIKAGSASVSGGTLDVTNSAKITTAGISAGISMEKTEYVINADATANANVEAVAITSNDGYIEKSKTDKPSAIAKQSSSVTANADPIYLKKAVISSTGTEATNPIITTTFGSDKTLDIADVQDAEHTFAITVDTTGSKGSVSTKYTASAGYTPAVADVTSGEVDIEATIQNASITKYLKKGSVSASTSVSKQNGETFLTIANGASADIELGAIVEVVPGYVQTGDAPTGVSAKYNIKKATLAGSTAATVDILGTDRGTTFTSDDGVVLHTSVDATKTYKEIKTETKILASGDSIGSASVAAKTSGWVDGSATAKVTGSGSAELAAKGSIFIEVYTGEFTFEA